MRIVLFVANAALTCMFVWALSMAIMHEVDRPAYYLSLAFSLATLGGNLFAFWPGRKP